MFGRLFRISLILAHALFFNVIVPGHTRGIITLDRGASTAATASDFVGVGRSSACCCDEQAPSDPRGRPTGRDRANCAICFVAARVTTPDVINLAPAALELVALLPLPPPLEFGGVTFVPTYDGRGPPAA